MGFIDKITFCNFKVFYGKETIHIGGKHLLIYGENGSGKSSIYWGIYTVFQAILKSSDEVKKYFDPNHEESLINTFYLESEATQNPDGTKTYPNINLIESYVELHLTNGNSFRVDSKGLEVVSDDEGIPLLHLEKLNKYSDFINYRILSNFYNFKNSEEINLWRIFTKNVFPFLNSNKGSSDFTLEQNFKEIVNSNIPFVFPENSEKFKLKGGKLPESFTSKIKVFNESVKYWLGEINGKVSTFYKNNFSNDGDPEFRISLDYKEPLIFKTKFYQYFKDRKREYNYAGFNEPRIGLKIEIKPNDSDDFILISRPQSFINEARLTRIALAIRFVLLLDFIRPDAEDKCLFLDDLLLSLDMSNRDKVMDIILDVFAPKYQVFFFTHERSLFHMIRRRLSNRNLLGNWKINEIFMDDFKNPQRPLFVESGDYLSKALKHLKHFDLPASGNYLRKECEDRMKYLLPEYLCQKPGPDGTRIKNLGNLIEEFFKYFTESLHLDLSDFRDLKEKKDLLLNPLSHDNQNSEIYKDEIYSLYKLLGQLSKVKKKCVLKSDGILTFKQKDFNGDKRIYKVAIKENLIFYKMVNQTWVNKNIQCEFISYEKNDERKELNHSVKFKDIQKVAYHHAMNENKRENRPNYLNRFEINDNITLEDLLELSR